MMLMFHAKPSPPADITVRDGDFITIGKTSLKVLNTRALTGKHLSVSQWNGVYRRHTFVGVLGGLILEAVHCNNSFLLYETSSSYYLTIR
jgi:Mg/Co/Ni transporter MgtE